MNYRVVRIEEDVEFGCEERKEGDPVMVFLPTFFCVDLAPLYLL